MTAFGTQFAETMALAWWKEGEWSAPSLEPVQPLALHPGAHVLHYASTCFDGFKAYRQPDSEIRIFRLDDHVERLRYSARCLCLPVPEADYLRNAFLEVLEANRAAVPDLPNSVYIRPVILGCDAAIGAAGHKANEACFFVLVSPVGAYFESSAGLRILIDDQNQRSTPGFGVAKAGGNYAAGLKTIEDARDNLQADQVLFCPGGDVQETGAANFFLLDEDRIVTRPIDDAILHGITRDSLLKLAPGQGFQVEERAIAVSEILDWSRRAEAALSGTAAVLAGIGTFLYRGEEHSVAGHAEGSAVKRLHDALADIHLGKAPDPFGWLTTL